MPTTAVIILEYNNAKDTLNCLESVLAHNTAPVNFIIIDNGSTDKQVIEDIRSRLKALFPDSYSEFSELDAIPASIPEAVFYLNNDNAGYAKGNNIGLEIAYKDPDIKNILILNSDILFVEDIIPRLNEDIDEKEDAAIISPVLYKKNLTRVDGNCARSRVGINDLILLSIPYPIDPFKIATKRKMQIPDKAMLMEIGLPSGSCMLMKKDFIRSIGGFDPNTFLYYEENILGEKIHQTGRRNYLDTSVKCIHLGATSTKNLPSYFTGMSSARSMNYFINNYLRPNLLQKAILKLFLYFTHLRMKLAEKIKHRKKLKQVRL